MIINLWKIWRNQVKLLNEDIFIIYVIKALLGRFRFSILEWSFTIGDRRRSRHQFIEEFWKEAEGEWLKGTQMGKY